jgi:hypothetical protein
MWRAVITQALTDAGSGSVKAEFMLAKAQALAWLQMCSEDFTTVCSLADLDPEWVRAKAKIAIENGCKWRLPAGKGWRTQKNRKEERELADA